MLEFEYCWPLIHEIESCSFSIPPKLRPTMMIKVTFPLPLPLPLDVLAHATSRRYFVLVQSIPKLSILLRCSLHPLSETLNPSILCLSLFFLSLSLSVCLSLSLSLYFPLSLSLSLSLSPSLPASLYLSLSLSLSLRWLLNLGSVKKHSTDHNPVLALKVSRWPACSLWMSCRNSSWSTSELYTALTNADFPKTKPSRTSLMKGSLLNGRRRILAASYGCLSNLTQTRTLFFTLTHLFKQKQKTKANKF